MSDQLAAWSGPSTWQTRLDQIVEMMREMSAQTDPQAMVRAYGDRVREIQANDGFIAVSRRGLGAGQYKITRATAFTEEFDPWKQPEKFPVHTAGVLGQWLYADKPQLIQDFRCPPGDPAEHLFGDARSVAIIPQYEGGVALNMVVVVKNEPHGFDAERFPEVFWQSNLFGRATSNLVLAKQVKETLEVVDRELRVVADIQRSLLPTELPTCVGLDLATHYQTSKQAGGDYFDFFDLPGHKLGMLIADVSGHGTPAAVLMAILHAIAHVNQTWTGACPSEGSAGEVVPPREWMAFVNRQLCEKYTRLSGTFVTAFYAVYDPISKQLTYASAGHNPPRLRLADPSGALSPISARSSDAGGPIMLPLDEAQGLPLGIVPDTEYIEATITLNEGDVLTLYTDGITEAFDAQRVMFGNDALDAAIMPARASAQEYLRAIIAAVDAHSGPRVDDDRTIIVAKVDHRAFAHED